MIRLYSTCFILAAVLQVIFAQRRYNHQKRPREAQDLGYFHPYQQLIPRHCLHAPPEVNWRKCCIMPHLYTKENLNSCGINTEKKDYSKEILKLKYKTPCQDGTCLMKNVNLLLADGSVNYEKLKTYIDEWAFANPNFTEAILVAKVICAKEPDSSWHIHKDKKICEPDRVYVCLCSYILWGCKLEETEECEPLRKHMAECRPYYEKPIKTLVEKISKF